MTRKKISASIKILNAIMILLGMISALIPEYGEATGFGKFLLYFTTQSNVWLLIWSAVMAAALLLGRDREWMYKVQLVLTTAITLTGAVYCLVLLPAGESGGGPISASNMLLHMITPVLAIIDLLAFGKRGLLCKKDSLMAMIPPLYYVVFASECYFLNVQFDNGTRYPYFFFNYDSPARFFGFSNVKPYFMGSFYWLILLTAFVIAVSLLYIRILKNPLKTKPKIYR